MASPLMLELLIQIKSCFLSCLIDYFVGHVWSIGMTDEILLFLSSSHCKCPACRRQWAVYHLVPIIKSRRIAHQSSPLPLCCLSPFGVIFIAKYSDFTLKHFPVLLLFVSVLWNQSSFPSCPHETCAHKKS